MTRRAFGLTPRGWTLAGAAAGLLVGGRMLGAAQLNVLGLAAVAAVVLAGVSVSLTRRTLTVARHVVPARLHVDDPARVDLLVTATRASPMLDLIEPIGGGRLRARFVLTPLHRGTTAEPAYRLPTDRRGPLVVGPTTALRTDPLGLVHRRRVVAPAETVLVRPRVLPIVAPALGAGRRHWADEHEAPRAPAADAGGEFLAVRPYEVGDDPRRVHWRSSARTDDLMVRQFVAPRRGHTLLVLDTRALDTDPSTRDAAFERAVEATASIVAALTRTRRPFECRTTGGTLLAPVGTDPQRTFDHLATVMPGEPDLLDAVARSRRPRPPELVILVTARADAHVAAARSLLARRTPSLLVATGGDVAGGATAGWVVDARSVPFPDAWRAAHPAHRAAPTRGGRPGPMSVVR